MKTRIAGPSDQTRIEEFLTGTDSATSYHQPAWGSLIEDCFGHRFIGLICEDGDGRIQGVLPLVHMNSQVFGNFIVSMPYFNYGGVCATDSRAAESMLQAAVEIARDLGAEHIELRQQENLNNGMAVKTSKVSMRLPLHKNPKELWDYFPSKLRSQIRIPMKKGMKIRVGKIEELDGFYEVFSVNMRDLGTPVYPKGFFRSILERFRESTWVATVTHSKLIRAGESLIAVSGNATFKHILDDYFASDERQATPLRTVQEIFTAWQQMHKVLKEDYFVRPEESQDDSLESSRMDVLIANPYGIFGVSGMRTVQEFAKFYAYGSGTDYALGALYASYGRPELDAEDLARLAINAAAEFDDGTEPPVECHLFLPVK